ncbi:MAG: carboxypeptidase-like regulatory domain-containing protein [Saprospiraceae bacterium]|nr:carboxypeptidase-like regulatory domain-containing protein [Saprospiraceae bacterium]
MKKEFLPLCVFIFLSFPIISFCQKFTLSGTIKDAQNGEYLIGASVYLPELKRGALTNEFGFYSLELPAQTSRVQFSFVGYTPQYRDVLGDKSLILDIELTTETTLQTLEVRADNYREQVQSTQMSVVKLSAKEAKLIPALLGETDILKTLQLKPGRSVGQRRAIGY